MKILCDVCNNHDASFFCTADEAALCLSCDHRVHHANKLASKHNRLSLLHPSPNLSPLCDICQDRRAFVLCKQDRAILCNHCDSSIHSVNEFTVNHDRFLLAGVKLSTISSSFTSSSSTNSKSNLVDSSSLIDKSVVVPSSTSIIHNDALEGTVSGGGGSTISQYLIETLPGWQVDDFLDSSSVPFAFSKVCFFFFFLFFYFIHKSFFSIFCFLFLLV